MKKIVNCSVLVFFMVFAIHAQNKTVNKTATKPIPKNTTPGLQLKTLEDSANYAMGMSVANFYRSQGITKINSAIVTKGLNDALSGKQLLLNDIQANNCMMTFLNTQQALKSKPNIEAGQGFLNENKKRQGVIATSSGLQYEVMKQGTGPKPLINDTVVCNYKGTFLNGTEFDNSYSRGAPAEFALTGVIKGWTEVLQLMPVGSKYKVYVPHHLAYGSGDYNGIPGGSLLIFEIELLSIKGK
jgi:FKBP-type peptidyl-prolyl cis-trans isomerase